MGRVVQSGTATDTMGLETVEFAASPWDEADFDGVTWRYVWHLGHDPDGQTYTVTVRAVDAAGHTGQVTQSLTVDLVPPAPVTITLSYTGSLSAGVVVAGDTITESNVTLSMDWTASSDGSGAVSYRAGWSTDPEPDSAALSAVAGRHYQESAAEPQPFYAHLVIEDAYGNQQVQTVGPVFVDAPTTPDYVDDLSYHGWLASGCSPIGADRELARNAYSGGTLAGVQRLYATWDGAALRLTWTGANWDSDGDLFIYLDTTTGGALVAYDPYGSGPAIALPDLAADYVIQVEDASTARLLRWNGAWQAHHVLTATHYRLDTSLQPPHTDLLIPWNWLGSPTSLKLVALASEDGALRIWAAIPDKNPLNSERVVDAVALPTIGHDFALTQHAEFATLGSGLCPNQGRFADADLHLSLTADPPGVEVGFLQHDLPGLLTPGMFLDADLDGEPDVVLPVDVRPVLVGHGETITYTLTYTNYGTVVAPGALVTLTARGGVALAGGSPQTFALTGLHGAVLVTGTVDKTLNGQSAEVDVVAADIAHGPFDWLWVQHGVDTAAPESLVLERPLRYVNAYTNTVMGTVDDPSGVPTITLQVQDVPTGTLVTSITCVDPLPLDGTWSCLWNAAGAPDGALFDLRVQASDRFGNTGAWTDWRRVEVDSTLPTLHLSEETQLALADNVLVLDELGLSGQVRDDREAAQVGVCVGPLGEPAQECRLYPATPITSPTIAPWYVLAPILGRGDGEWQTLHFFGLDSVGNRSAVTTTRATRVDVVPPAVTVTTRLEALPLGMGLPFIEGLVSDGSGVVSGAPSTQLYVAQPDGNVTWYPLTFDGDNWSFGHVFTATGDYTFGYEFRDQVGNLQSAGPFPLHVFESDLVVDLSVGLSATSNPAFTTYPLTYTFIISNAGPGIATTSTLTVTLPAQVDLSWASQGYGVVDDVLVFSLGDVVTGTPSTIQVQVDIPLTTTGSLVCSAETGSGMVEMRPADNGPRSLTSDIAQPITGLEMTSDAPTVLGETTTLTATFASGTGVALEWSLGDGETVWTHSDYELGATSTVTHIYPEVGVYTVVVTASNIVNTVTASTQITTDIPLAIPLLYESFEEGFLPPNWLRSEPLEDHCWHWGPGLAYSGFYSAMYDDLFGPQDGWLATPLVTPTLGSELVFWQYQRYATHYEAHSIWVSTGSQDPKDGDFVLLTELGPGAEDVWEEVRVDLSAYAGQPIYIAFRYQGDWADEWYVDDVQVTARLVVLHDGPTPLGQTTTLTASVATGSNPVFEWALGDGQSGFGPLVTHSYAAGGDYTVVVTASNSVSFITGTAVVPVRSHVFLPVLMSGYTAACPDEHEPDDVPEQASVITTDGAAQQHTFHQAGDVDWVAFTVSDDTLDYAIETFDLVGGADTVIYLYDSDRERLLDWNDDAGPDTRASRLTFRPYHSGTFYLKVVNYDSDVAGCAVGYAIRVRAASPRADFP